VEEFVADDSPLSKLELRLAVLERRNARLQHADAWFVYDLGRGPGTIPNHAPELNRLALRNLHLELMAVLPRLRREVEAMRVVQ
jgi:hypothetical protein